MLLFFRKICNFFYKAICNVIDHDGVEHAGYMSFMNILSLFPFVVFLVAIAGFLGETTIGIKFIQKLFDSMPHNLTQALQPRISEILSGPPQGLLTLSILGAIWTASSSFEAMRTILNRVYHVKSPPAYIFRRLTSILQFLLLSALIVLTMFLLVFIPIIYEKLDIILKIESTIHIENLIPTNFFDPVSQLTRDLALAFSLFMFVSILYYIIPNKRLKFKSVTPGAILVVILWLITGDFMALMIANYKQVSIIYGSLAGMIFSMLFFFVINLIFIFGAEINYLIYKKKYQ